MAGPVRIGYRLVRMVMSGWKLGKAKMIREIVPLCLEAPIDLLAISALASAYYESRRDGSRERG